MSSLPELHQEDIAKAGAPKLIKPDIWVAYAIKGATADCDDQGDKATGHYRINFRCAPLKDPSDTKTACSPLVYDRIQLPFTNKTFVSSSGEKHTAPDTYSLMAMRLVAFYGEYDPETERGAMVRPRKVAAGYVFNGEVIAADSYKTAEGESIKHNWQIGLKLFHALASGENPIQDYVFFGKLRHNEYNGRLFQNFVDVQPQLPANAELVTDPDAFRFQEG